MIVYTIYGEEEVASQTCIYCLIEKPLSDFPRHSHHKNNYDSRCKECIKKHTEHREKLRKEAPPKPERCECCGCIPKKWVLDHDHKTGKFRGWICDDCNIGLGKLGDNVEGVQKAIIYLQKFENRNG